MLKDAGYGMMEYEGANIVEVLKRAADIVGTGEGPIFSEVYEADAKALRDLADRWPTIEKIVMEASPLDVIAALRVNE